MSLTLTLERGGGEVSGSGTNIELDGTIAGGAIESVEMYGDTEQTTYSGKNKLTNLASLNASDNGVANNLNSDGSVTCSGIVGSGWNGWGISGYVANELAAGTYTFSIDHAITSDITVSFRDSSNNTIGAAAITAGQTSATATISGQTARTSLWVSATTGTQINFTIKAQLDSGSTATSFEPYVGGTASPNPDYPQTVKTVAGEQTITISDGGEQSQVHTLDLGSIELCKIGSYQDYIYKSGGNWYVHKETRKITLDGTETYATIDSNPTSTDYYYINTNAFDSLPNTAGYSYQLSNRFQNFDTWLIYNTAVTKEVWSFGASAGTNRLRFMLKKTRLASATTSAVQTWFASNPTDIYYALATPTDTQITNADLIAQLEALNAGETYDGTTVITVSSENLAGPLEVTVSTNIAKTYTEVEIGSPFTITDVEGKSSNTTLDGNVYVDWAYNKKQYSFDLFNLTPQDYADIRAFYDYQFSNSAFPTITIPELNIDKLPVYMEISSRNIINQCLLTDKLTIKFRETVQP